MISHRRPPSRAAVRAAVHRCISRLDHGVELASIAVTGAEPERAARFLASAVAAIQADLRELQPAIRRSE